MTLPDLPGYARLVLDDRIIGSNTESSLGAQQPNPVFWAISLEPGHEGELLWNKTWTLPIADLHVDLPYGFLPNLEDRVFVVAGKETRQFWGFSIDTGEQIWGPTESEQPLSAFSNVYSWEGWGHGLSAYGKLLSGGMGGVMSAYDLQTGQKLWSYELSDPFQEILWSNYWPAAGAFITDGKVYIFHTEHSVIDPKPRGAPFVCLDIETGEEVFRVDGLLRTTRWGGTPVIGDSIITAYDTYDNQIYAIGKGPSDITVEAPLIASDWGDKIILRGTVMDVSAGTKDPAIVARFPKGVPAVADDCMGDWMKYVYKQFERPMAAGVEVKLEVVVDPNGNWYDIGTTYTDSTGFYKISWEPPVPGEYLILATFAGTESYYGSYVETAVVVNEGPTPGAFMESELLTPTGSAESVITPLISTEVAIVAVVAIASIIGLAAYSLLRKK